MSSGVDKKGTAAVVYNTNAASKARCGWAAEVVGEANDLVALQLSVTNETVVITIAGAYSTAHSSSPYSTRILQLDHQLAARESCSTRLLQSLDHQLASRAMHRSPISFSCNASFTN
jgi:hypothetical protein